MTTPDPTPDPNEVDDPSSPSGRRRAPLKRASSRFFDDPASGRNAIVLIVAADIAIVIVGGLTMWLLNPAEYADLGTAFWYILQTITTVGYGDVTPTEPIGRLVGAIFMMIGIAVLAILTASITSAFLDAKQAERRDRQDATRDDDQARLEARLDELIERLTRMEDAASRRDGPGGS